MNDEKKGLHSDDPKVIADSSQGTCIRLTPDLLKKLKAQARAATNSFIIEASEIMTHELAKHIRLT